MDDTRQVDVGGGQKPKKRQSQVRSRAGCATCRERRKRCDYVKPTCTECSRLGLSCVWIPKGMGLPQALRSGYYRSKWHAAYDHPRLLKASPTSCLLSEADKQYEQFLFERGHLIFPVGSSGPSASSGPNMIASGLLAARNYPEVMMSRRSLAAAQLSILHPHLQSEALKYYDLAARMISRKLDEEAGSPSEQSCAAVAFIDFAEDPPSRKMYVDFDGFHFIMQRKLQTSPGVWTPNRILLELYVHKVAAFSTFYSKTMFQKGITINYVDWLIGLRNETYRPFGPTILGVPDELFSAAYQLNFVRNISTSHFDQAHKIPKYLKSISQKLDGCQVLEEQSSSLHLRQILPAKLFYLACLVYFRKLSNAFIDELDTSISGPVEEAATALRECPSEPAPSIVLIWPLTILGLSAADESAFGIIRARMQEFISICGLRGFSTVIALFDFARGGGPGSSNYTGLNVLFQEDPLQTVTM